MESVAAVLHAALNCCCPRWPEALRSTDYQDGPRHDDIVFYSHSVNATVRIKCDGTSVTTCGGGGGGTSSDNDDAGPVPLCRHIIQISIPTDIRPRQEHTDTHSVSSSDNDDAAAAAASAKLLRHRESPTPPADSTTAATGATGATGGAGGVAVGAAVPRHRFRREVGAGAETGAGAGPGGYENATFQRRRQPRQRPIKHALLVERVRVLGADNGTGVPVHVELSCIANTFTLPPGTRGPDGLVYESYLPRVAQENPTVLALTGKSRRYFSQLLRFDERARCYCVPVDSYIIHCIQHNLVPEAYVDLRRLSVQRSEDHCEYYLLRPEPVDRVLDYLCSVAATCVQQCSDTVTVSLSHAAVAAPSQCTVRIRFSYRVYRVH